MFLKIIFKKCVMPTEEKRNSIIKTVSIENYFISIISTNQVDKVKHVFNFQSDNNYRKQLSFNLEDWWIVFLNHIGLPLAINCYSKLQGSCNDFN
jgi:hypothetical protein